NKLADLTNPGTTQDQDVYESSSLAKEQVKYFEGGDYLIGDHAYVPSSTVMVPFLESDLRRFRGTIGSDHYSSGNVYPGAENELDPEHVLFNEYLELVLKRGEDCQRAFRHGSQVKDEEREQVFASNWILACMMFRNLVLGDDTGYYQSWDAEQDVMECEVLRQQVQCEQQILFPKPPGRRIQPYRRLQSSYTRSHPTLQCPCCAE
ncbi:hypothetical protein BGZ81_007227, partial [Podila clonocystis]